jgi:hypothetical protein
MFCSFGVVYYSDQQMHNIHINNEFYIVSTTCFDAFASCFLGRRLENDASASKHHNLKGDSLKMMKMHRNT